MSNFVFNFRSCKNLFGTYSNVPTFKRMFSLK